jgi:hypothetical protein
MQLTSVTTIPTQSILNNTLWLRDSPGGSCLGLILFAMTVQRALAADLAPKRVIIDYLADEEWATGQKAFAHSQAMPRLLKNFCPTCVEMVLVGDKPVRVTRGVYLPIEHQCGSVHRSDGGQLTPVMTVAEFDAANAAKRVRERQAVKEDRITFKANYTKVNQSAMFKLMNLLYGTDPATLPDEEVEQVEEMPYAKALRFLLAKKRWSIEKQMVGRRRRGWEAGDPLPYYPEARLFEDIFSESRTFPN